MVFVAEITFVGNFFIGGKSAELHPFSTVSQVRCYSWPKLCRIQSYFCPNEVLEPLWPSKISHTSLFSKPILRREATIAQCVV